MKIGEFARQAGISTSKVRFYEERGLLPRAARQTNGYRAYDVADLRIITFINEATALGFSLAEVARFMRQPLEERRDKRRLVDALKVKLNIMDQHLTTIDDQRRRITAFIAHIQEGE